MEAIRDLGHSFATRIVLLVTSAHWTRYQLSSWRKYGCQSSSQRLCMLIQLWTISQKLDFSLWTSFNLKRFCSFSPGICKMHTSEEGAYHIMVFKRVWTQAWMAGLCWLLQTYHQGTYRGQTSLPSTTIFCCQMVLMLSFFFYSTKDFLSTSCVQGVLEGEELQGWIICKISPAASANTSYYTAKIRWWDKKT